MMGALSEGEHVGADTGIEAFDLESAIRDRPRLADQLIEARFLHGPPSLRVHIRSMVGRRRSAVDLHAKANGARLSGRDQDEVLIAGMKTVDDGPGRLVEGGEFPSDRPN